MKYTEVDAILGEYQADVITEAEKAAAIDDVFDLLGPDQNDPLIRDWNATLNLIIDMTADETITLDQARHQIDLRAKRFVNDLITKSKSQLYEVDLIESEAAKDEDEHEPGTDAELGAKKAEIERLSLRGESAEAIHKSTGISRSFVYETRADMRKRGELT